MIINLEGIAAKLTGTLYGQSSMDELEKARIEYGFSLTLGIGLGLVLALLLGVVLGTAPYVLLLIFSALFLRLFSGGAHCSSYDRCLLLSLSVFVPLSLLVKYLVTVMEAESLALAYAGIVLVTLVMLIIKDKKLAAIIVLLNAVVLGAFLIIHGAFPANIMLPVGTGILVQTLMVTPAGEWLVEKTDNALKFIRI